MQLKTGECIRDAVLSILSIMLCIGAVQLPVYGYSTVLLPDDTDSRCNKMQLEKFQSNSFMQNTLVFPEHPLVSRFKRQYMNEKGFAYLSAIMQRSAPYRRFIIELLEQENMPPELLFLPVIESGFLEKATSRSGAAGIWQFMKNSVGGYNIHINDWMDERFDPWKTSSAAVKKLKLNYSQLGDWPLALAAYNCGMGAIKAAIKKAGNTDYWYLSEHGYLKKETMYYVPKFLAIAEILSKSDVLGIDWGNPDAYPQTATIEIKRAVDIRLLAEETGIEIATMKKLNPALHYAITPPNIHYHLRIPAEYEEPVKTILNQSDKLLIKYYQYRIKSGDTLYALAKHYGITVQNIMYYNPGVSAQTLKIGKIILIPALKAVDAYQGKSENTYTADFSGSHIIQSGDTLWSISRKYAISVELLAQKNNLRVNSVLKLGNILKVPML